MDKSLITNHYQKIEQTASLDETGIEELLETIDLTTASNDTTLEETMTTNWEESTDTSDIVTVLRPEGEMAEKLAKAAPYNIFFTTITASNPTHNQPLSVTFQELLDPSLGELESSVQINFVIDSEWLLRHYKIAGHSDKPLLILYGDENERLEKCARKNQKLTAVKVEFNRPYGCHHTKMMIFAYKDKSMRIVVSSANLFQAEWENRTQGLWISPRCPPLPENAQATDGESSTEFRKDLKLLLNWDNIPQLKSWLKHISHTDFTDINVFLVSSVPGVHKARQGYRFGHPRIHDLLTKHCTTIDDNSPIIAQCSSFGRFGRCLAESWLTTNILPSFATGNGNLPEIKIIYPTLVDVMDSHNKLHGGGSLMYTKEIHGNQKWIKRHMNHWKWDGSKRTHAMPHIKSYCRLSESRGGVYWFLLTSANLSGSAMGGYNHRQPVYGADLFVNNYETGVLFLPKFVLKPDAEIFPLLESTGDAPAFPIPYDLPLIPYEETDVPFLIEYLQRFEMQEKE